MKILALDTALHACSAAIAIDGKLAARHHEVLQRGHAEKIVPMVEQVRQACGISPDELDLIVVTVGPGTFTGVRIGLAAARALALPHRLPILGITTLQALAWGVEAEGPVIAAIDARRGEIYVQAFDSAWQPTNDAAVMTPAAAAAAFASRKAVIVGTGASLLLPLAPGLSASAGPEEPDAGVIALAAAAHADAAVAGQPPAPLYLRAPDAKLPVSAG